MANFRLEWHHVDPTLGHIIEILGAEKVTLTENTHYEFEPPRKIRRHSHKLIAKIVYLGACSFVRSAPRRSANVTSDTGVMVRCGMDAAGGLHHVPAFEIGAGEILQVLYTTSMSGYME